MDKNKNIHNIYKSGLSLNIMKKEVFILFVFGLIFGIFLIEGVSADINFALGGTASITDTGSWPYRTSWTFGNPEYINDNNLGTSQGLISWGKDVFRNWMETYLHYEAVVDLGSPQTINKIKYLRANVVPAGSGFEKTYLYYNSQWNEINSRGFLAGTATEEITGNWNGVSQVKVEFYLGTGWFSSDQYASSYIYELEAWGPDPFVCGDGSCNGNEGCSSCPADCGACPVINTCSSPDDIIMKLTTSDTSLGALWDYNIPGSGEIIGDTDNGVDNIISSLDERISGELYIAPVTGQIDSVSIYISSFRDGWNWGEVISCAIYDENRNFIAQTEELNNPQDDEGWNTFNFPSVVNVIGGKEYSLVCSADVLTGEVAITTPSTDNPSPPKGYGFSFPDYNSWPPASIPAPTSLRGRSIYATYGDISPYIYDICYSDIFGSAYTGDLGTVHDCVGTDNKVLGLSATGDAFGETPEGGTYTTNEVCYGDLECISTDVAGCTSFGGQIILSLENPTGSLISAGDFSGYNTKICCRPAQIPAGNIYWANMNGNPITSAEIGDSVLMIVENIGLNQGDSVIFEIYEDDLIFNDNIITGGDAINGLVDANGYVKAKWTILQSYLDKTSDLDNFIFKANSLTSNELLINILENNSPPSTQIIKPIAETNYVIRIGQIDTNLIDFEQISSDIDDDLALTWKFGDGQSNSFDNCLSGTNCNTTHQYTTAGTKNIILSAQEIGRSSAPVKDNSRVYVYSQGVKAYVVIDQIVTGRLVEIDATQTKVSDCDYVQATCEGKYGAGNCYQITDEINPIDFVWCYDKTLRVNGIDSNPNLFLDWTSDGVAFTPTQIPGQMKYIKIFDEPGEHIINLNVGYNPNNP